MKSKKFLAFLMVLLMVAAMLSGCKKEAEPDSESDDPKTRWGVDKIVIVLMPGEDSPEVAYTRNVFDTALSEVLMGLPVEEYHANNYSAMIEAMRTGHAHIGYFGPFSYVHAVDRANAEAFAIMSVDGTHGYTSKIITHVDSGIQSLDDLKDRSFGFADPESTSGNIVPSNEILNYFQDSMPNLSFDDLHVNGKFFSSVLFTGTHANSIQGVYKQDIEAAGVASTGLDSMIKSGEVEEDKIRILHTSPRIPTSLLAIQGDLPKELKDLIINFFYEWDDEDFWKTMSSPETRYWPVKDSEYDYVRELRDKFDLTE
ncbi:MAG: phosphate/phosphite/phosphonate ABC transporter substrate-binding protein [Oscillospiraceae bacterium]|nr:phosphate/phosphite/phosphonate ABC transporter substrate-binding protein [Oscillospiraceae bacterium]